MGWAISPPVDCARSLDPAVSFTEDPLRMLRAARFIARFLAEARSSFGGRGRGDARSSSRSVSPERIRDELDKIMLLDVPSEALWFVVRIRAWRPTSCRSFPVWRSSRIRSIATKDVAGAHVGGGGQDVTGPALPPRGALPRRRQAAHENHHRWGGEFSPSRGRGSPA